VGVTGAEVPFYRSIISNFMVYQDRLDTFMTAIPISRNFRVIFYNLSEIVFEVNIVAKQKQALLVTIFFVFLSVHCSQLFCLPAL